MGIGRFQQRIKFRQYTSVSDLAGGFTQTYADKPVETGVVNCWGKIIPLSSDKFVLDESLQHKVIYDILIRATKGFRPTKDLLVEANDGLRTFNAEIVSVLNADLKRNWWLLRVAEVQ